MINKITKQSADTPSPLEYPFAMSVFYRKDKNPHGPSSRPIMVATLERADYTAGLEMLAGKSARGISVNIPSDAPIVQGLFTEEMRLNLGEFQHQLTIDNARNYFLKTIGERLSLSGQPYKIGTIADIHGHPMTGWPAKEKKSAGGCLSSVAMCAVAVVIVTAILVHILD